MIYSLYIMIFAPTPNPSPKAGEGDIPEIWSIEVWLFPIFCLNRSNWIHLRKNRSLKR